MSRARLTGASCLLLVGLGACDALVGAGGRQFDSSILCNDSGCACKEGFGDCDESVDNGCETDLNDPKNCGACKNDCGAGKCEKLACVCDPGFADCDKTLVGCETDLTKEPKHCGTCERDCLTGTCSDSLCDPQLIPNTTSAYGFGVNDGNIYFTSVDNPGLFKQGAAGGPLKTVGMSVSTGKVVKIVDGTIYWSTLTEVLATPLAGGTTVMLAKDVEPQYQLTLGGGYAYWDNPDAMMTGFLTLMRVSTTAGGMPESVTSIGDSQFLHDFIASSEDVYFNVSTKIRRVAHGSMAATDFVTSQQSATFYAVDGDTLYFAGQTSGTYRVPFSGGTPEKIADAAPGYGILVTDADNIYFLTSVADKDPAQAVWRAPKKGGAPAVKLAIDAAMFSGQPISVDDKWVYWLTLSGVNRVAK